MMSVRAEIKKLGMSFSDFSRRIEGGIAPQTLKKIDRGEDVREDIVAKVHNALERIRSERNPRPV